MEQDVNRSHANAREALAIDVAGSIRSERVIEVLSRMVSDESLQIALSQLVKPWRDGTDESFNGKFYDEADRWRMFLTVWRRAL